MKTIVMDLGVAGSDLSAGQMVYIRPWPCARQEESVFPDIDQMLCDVGPIIDKEPDRIMAAIWRRFEENQKELHRQVSLLMGFPQHLLDATHRIR